MKTIKIILLLLVVTTGSLMGQKSVSPTKNLDAYVGTWVYQNSDTIFKIRLQKGQKIGMHPALEIVSGKQFHTSCPPSFGFVAARA